MKVADKLAKVSESFTINMYDNGFMVEIGGRNKEDDWASAKIMVTTVEDLLDIVKQAVGMERES